MRCAWCGYVSTVTLRAAHRIISGGCGKQAHTMGPACSSRLVSISWILSLMALLFFLYLKVKYLSDKFADMVFSTSASLFQSFFTSGACSLHCSPIILDISGFASPGC